MKKIIDKLHYLLFAIGFVFLYLIIYHYIDTPPTFQKIETTEAFDLDEFLEKTDFAKMDSLDSKKSITLLYMITTNSCNPCIKEVQHFHSIIDENGLKNKFNQFLIVTDAKVNKAKRFARTVQFDIPVFYGYDSNYVNVLQKFGNETEERQLIVIDNMSKQIVKRIKLKVGVITEKEDKLDLINSI